MAAAAAVTATVTTTATRRVRERRRARARMCGNSCNFAFLCGGKGVAYEVEEIFRIIIAMSIVIPTIGGHPETRDRRITRSRDFNRYNCYYDVSFRPATPERRDTNARTRF